ncbi:hypothetical protein FGO68_gene1223 [Halteria grandinella]|uniref:UBC core domain-containing protein n=1 Tax=Halteria grandinella TaxID=5974 RepID=A0A8J8NJS7_HALGN|nr:hypothetical protein FGO68_gene1223 [Halteria grandinella]
MLESGQTQEQIDAAIAAGKKPPGQLRVIKDLTDIELPSNAKLIQPDPANFMLYHVDVDLSKEDCYWRGGKYRFTITIPHSYPHEAPKCHCDTQIYHPNIDMQGNVCQHVAVQGQGAEDAQRGLA